MSSLLIDCNELQKKNRLREFGTVVQSLSSQGVEEMMQHIIML